MRVGWNLFLFAAIVVAIIVAVLAFLTDTATQNLVGLLAVALACGYAAAVEP